MADKGFGSELWKNVQSVKLDKVGALRAPVRADGKRGIVVGIDAIAEADKTAGAGSAAPPRRSWLARLRRR